MKIALVNYRYFISGGPERYYFNIKEILERARYEVVSILSGSQEVKDKNRSPSANTSLMENKIESLLKEIEMKLNNSI